jgi:hypothetical protein
METKKAFQQSKIASSFRMVAISRVVSTTNDGFSK